MEAREVLRYGKYLLDKSYKKDNARIFLVQCSAEPKVRATIGDCLARCEDSLYFIEMKNGEVTEFRKID